MLQRFNHKIKKIYILNMARNLRKFQNEAEYSAATLNYPAVSWVVNGEVHFDKTAPIPPFGGLTVKYNITDTTSEITLFNGGGGSSTSESSSESGSGSGGGGALPTRMIVDGVEETPINTWRFETAGEHIVQYEFEDNTVTQDFIQNVADSIPDATEVIVGTDITIIGSAAFNNSYLTSATCLSATPPIIGDTIVFGGGSLNYPIYVPASAVDTYKAAHFWSNLASRIQAIQ